MCHLELNYSHFFSYDLDDGVDNMDDMDYPDEYLCPPPIFSQACETIRNHLLLSDVRYLDIFCGCHLTSDLEVAASDIGKLLGSTGMLE